MAVLNKEIWKFSPAAAGNCSLLEEMHTFKRKAAKKLAYFFNEIPKNYVRQRLKMAVLNPKIKKFSPAAAGNFFQEEMHTFKGKVPKNWPTFAQNSKNDVLFSGPKNFLTPPLNEIFLCSATPPRKIFIDPP